MSRLLIALWIPVLLMASAWSQPNDTAPPVPAAPEETPGAPSPPAAPEAREARALWVVRYALSSPQAVSRIVEIARRHGINALFVQVRGRGDAYYLGGLEPRAEFLASQPTDFDPLAQIVREAHDAGIQVHAWLNTYYLWSGGKAPLSPRHALNAHPEWLLTGRSGEPVLQAGSDVEGSYLDPAHVEARTFLRDLFLDVARRYSVDGIHFDYVRYPGRDYGFSDYALGAFGQSVAGRLSAEESAALAACPDRLAYPKVFSQSWSQWRRDQVTDLVRVVSRDVKSIKPQVAVSAATIAWGSYRGFAGSDAYTRVAQDWFGWLREGLLDLVVPMTYHTDTRSFQGWTRAAVDNSHGKQVWAGIGAYLIPPESTAEKIRAAREVGAQGFSLFSYDAITRDGTEEGYLRRVQELAFPEPALVPPFPWQVAPPAEEEQVEPAP